MTRKWTFWWSSSEWTRLKPQIFWKNSTSNRQSSSSSTTDSSAATLKPLQILGFYMYFICISILFNFFFILSKYSYKFIRQSINMYKLHQLFTFSSELCLDKIASQCLGNFIDELKCFAVLVFGNFIRIVHNQCQIFCHKSIFHCLNNTSFQSLCKVS